MTTAVIEAPDLRLEINLQPLAEISEADFVALCAANPELRLERTAEGEIIIMVPEGGESSHDNVLLTTAFQNWANETGTGVVFGSSVGYRLPNGSTRSPDVSWVRRDRLARLTREQKRQFLPLCPDVVIEVRSPSDRMTDLMAKMVEYVANGAMLGWLIDPDSRTVYVYRPGRAVEQLDGPMALSGEPELPGLVLGLGGVWEPGF